MDKPRVVLVTGDAPYLGGPVTWSALRESAPQFDFSEVDLLDIDSAPPPRSSVRRAIARALPNAAALVAHGTCAGPAIEAAAEVAAGLPVLLLSPRFFTRSTVRLRVVRSALHLGSPWLERAARAKHRRLLRDPAYLRAQVASLVAAHAISSALLAEALQRLQHPNMEPLLRRTAQSVTSILEPVDAAAWRATARVTALFGRSPIDARMRRRIDGRILETAWSAPMIEDPAGVSALLAAEVSS